VAARAGAARGAAEGWAARRAKVGRAAAKAARTAAKEAETVARKATETVAGKAA